MHHYYYYYVLINLIIDIPLIYLFMPDDVHS